MITPGDELIPFGRVPRLIRSPRPPHVGTITRWALHGVGNPRVKLETFAVGGRRYTTAVALEALIAATTGRQSEALGPADGHRMSAIRRAEHELDSDGLA